MKQVENGTSGTVIYADGLLYNVHETECERRRFDKKTWERKGILSEALCLLETSSLKSSSFPDLNVVERCLLLLTLLYTIKYVQYSCAQRK